jgi:hypothetical protein
MEASMGRDSYSKDVTCWSCKVNSATESFQYGGHETFVCGRCHQWLRARDELDGLLRDALISESETDTIDIIARLDLFLNTNRRIDDTGEFARKIAHHRVMALVEANRYAEAELACSEWKNLGFANAWERWEHGYEWARILMVLQKPEQAFRALDEALEDRDPYFLGIAEKLELLVELAQLLGETFKPKHLELTRKVADAYGIQLDNSEAPAEMILTLAKSIHGKLPRAV